MRGETRLPEKVRESGLLSPVSQAKKRGSDPFFFFLAPSRSAASGR
jgi:hypothetical protein